MNQVKLIVGRDGQIIIPTRTCEELGLSQSDVLSLAIENGKLILQTEEPLLKQLYELAGEPPEGERMSDSLIRERRETALKEPRATP